MSIQRDLNEGDLKRRLDKLEAFMRQSKLAAASVGRSGMRIYDGGYLRIENGGLEVIGTAHISGTLSVTGQANFSGQVGISGPLNVTGTTTIGGNTDITGELNVTGPTTLDGVLDIGGDTTITGQLDVEGDTEISGTLDITGDTTVASDFEITSGGLFKSGVTEIAPTGRAEFGDFIIDPSSNRLIQAPGGWLFSNGPDQMGLASSGTSSIDLSGSRVQLSYGADGSLLMDGAGSVLRHGASNVTVGAGRVDVNTGKTWLNGELEVTSTSRLSGLVYLTSLPTTSAQPNLYIGPSGQVYRSTWEPEEP